MTDGRRLARTSLIGFLAGGLLFGALGVYMNLAIGDPALSNPGPTLVLAVIGGTVAGLIAPMIRRGRGG
jgi:hypothetical protein